MQYISYYTFAINVYVLFKLGKKKALLTPEHRAAVGIEVIWEHFYYG